MILDLVEGKELDPVEFQVSMQSVGESKILRINWLDSGGPRVVVKPYPGYGQTGCCHSSRCQRVIRGIGCVDVEG